MNVVMMPTLHVGHGLHLRGLSVFPVWTDAPTVTGLDTRRAARVRVEEREGSPVVGELVLKNQGAKSALLVAGETTSSWSPASSWSPVCRVWRLAAGAPQRRCDGRGARR